MKLIPIVTALAVAAALLFFVLDRDALLGAAGVTQTQDATPAAATPTLTSPPADTDAGVGVIALRSVAQQVDSAVILRGRTEAARQVTVSAETSGQVISEPRRKGADVAAGEVLCRLDPGTRQAALSEARARMAEAEINLNAAQRLSQDGFSSETRLVSAQAAMESARAAVAFAEQEITKLEITAPFAGLLETDTTELGTLMQPGSPCATIIQLDPIKLVGFVPELDVDKVTIGAPAGARLTSGREVTGQVTFVSRSADELTRTFRVEVTVPNRDQSISDGQTADILIASDGQMAHLVAQSSLTLNDDGVLGVRTIDSANIAVFKPVTLVRDTAEGVWVTGLPARVDIITVGQEFVTDGVRVNPTFQEAKG